MHHVIHRGADEIGGICIEVAADDGTRILLDLGMPLHDEHGDDYPPDTAQSPTAELVRDGVLRDIPGLYADDPTAPRFAAIVLTHAHLDHYGLAHHAHPDTPVYASGGTLALLEVGRVFFRDAAQPTDIRPLPGDGPLRLGPFTLTDIPVDHAAPDSRAVLVEADGQRLLFSGDLRAHGRTGWRFDAMLSDERLRGVEWLLLEGTTLGRSTDSHGLRSERDVEEELVGLARDRDRVVVVVASGQNLDRLVSCYRAAVRTGRELVVDPYQAFVLMKLAPLSDAIPQFTWEKVRVGFVHGLVERLKAAGMMDLARKMAAEAKVKPAEIAAEPRRFLLCARGSRPTTKLLDVIGADRVRLVWSMWSGYWKRGGAMRDWCERHGVAAHFVHSGGHAWPEDLERLIQAIEPKQLEWVHTEPGHVGQ